MNEFVKLLNGIDSQLSRSRIVNALLIGGAFIFCAAVCISAFLYAEHQHKYVYVLENGKSLLALQTDAVLSKDLEVSDHVARFHELFFNLAPNAESISANLEKAYMLSDRSAYNYAQDLAEKGYYARMISANVTQQVQVDSVLVRTDCYPYEAQTFARLYVLRESNISEYALESKCKVVDSARSESNPHGLMIEGWTLTRNDKIETRRR